MKLPLPRNLGSTARSCGLAALFCLASGSLPAETGAAGLPVAKSAESEGFSSARLARIDALLGHLTSTHQYAGAVWLVARDGQVVSQGAVGYSDLEAKTPMTASTEFAIMSMTKLITTTTALALWEEGRFNLNDPIEKYLPELSNLKIYVSGPAESPVYAAATRKPTVRNLLTQTSGFTYGFFSSDPAPIRAIYAKAGLFDSTSNADFVRRAAGLPLLFEPGHSWNYGINTDLIGVMIERLTGKTLGQAMRDRVLGPLGMADTSFSPPADPSRLAKVYHTNAAGQLVEATAGDRAPVVHFESGGGGLFSTAHDYALFAQMLLNGGELRGKRILGRKTVAFMTSNQLGNLENQKKGPYDPPGFGLGVRVRLDNAADYETLGSPGEYGWEGIMSTYVSIDPAERMFSMVLTQHQPYDEHKLFETFANSVYQALEK